MYIIKPPGVIPFVCSYIAVILSWVCHVEFKMIENSRFKALAIKQLKKLLEMVVFSLNGHPRQIITLLCKPVKSGPTAF